MRILIVLVALASAGCLKQPDIFAPPMQRKPLLITPSDKIGHYAAMGSPDASMYILSGVASQTYNHVWRSIEQDAQFRFRLPVTRKLRLKALLYLPQPVFDATGPLEATFFVNDKELGKAAAGKVDEVLFEKAVPEEWLTSDTPVQVRIHVDKAFTPPDGSAKQTFFLNGIGFVQ